MVERVNASQAVQVRLDKWLWAARLYKTRSLAADEVVKGRVQVNGQACKPSKDVKTGDRISLRRGGLTRVIDVLGLSQVRGPAPVAQLLYRETEESQAAAQLAALNRRMGTEPALEHGQGRPTKRNRRQLADWQRWSASLDDA